MDLVTVSVIYSNAEDITKVYSDCYSPYSVSRYKRKSIMEYSDGLYYSIELPEDLHIVTDDVSSYVVKGSDENRLDLIAYKFYGDATMFWVIASYNDIVDPMDVPVGTVLLIPSKASLYVSGGVLS